ISLENVAETRRQKGEPDVALDLHRRALDIRSRGVEMSKDARWQEELSISHNHLGDMSAERGASEEADKHYRAALDIRRTLAASVPANLAWRRNLASSLHRIGDFQLARGNAAAAGEFYAEALEIYDQIAKAAPQQGQAQADLAVAHDKVADIAIRRGDTS